MDGWEGETRKFRKYRYWGIFRLILPQHNRRPKKIYNTKQKLLCFFLFFLQILQQCTFVLLFVQHYGYTYNYLFVYNNYTTVGKKEKRKELSTPKVYVEAYLTTEHKCSFYVFSLLLSLKDLLWTQRNEFRFWSHWFSFLSKNFWSSLEKNIEK